MPCGMHSLGRLRRSTLENGFPDKRNSNNDKEEKMAVSGKYGSITVPNIPEDEPVFIFRAQDLLTIPILEAYKTLLTIHGSPLAENIEKEILRFREWERKRKIPD